MVNDFDKIYEITSTMTKREKGDYFEKYVYDLFLNHPELSIDLEKIWLYRDVPQQIIKKLKLPKRDKGIDLLAIINGKYYAIQCKYRQNPNDVVSWSEIATFFGLSFGMTDQIYRGIVVTNTNRICRELADSEKVKAIYGDFFNKKKIATIFDNKPQIYPRNYQLTCIDRVNNYFKNNNCAIIEMACGTGKTLTSYLIHTIQKSTKTIIFVPSLYLLTQFYKNWHRQSYLENKYVRFLLIGSECGIANNKFVTRTTNPEIIADNLKHNNLIVICTYQSCDKLVDASKNIQFDFAIFDEAHHTVGTNLKSSLGLFNKNINIKKRLFMTATPKIYKHNYESDIISMNNVDIYGKCVYKYNIRSAINNKYLTDYKIYIPYIDCNHIKKIISDKKNIRLIRKYDSQYVATAIILLKQINNGDHNHLITYHNNIKSIKIFCDLLEFLNKKLYNDDIYIRYLEGSDSMSVRNTTINKFNENKLAILCTARVLNEGVDIPIIDSICFVDDKYSTTDIIQCIGRCLRLHKDKSLSKIIIPIFCDNIYGKKYSTLIRIFKSLTTTDTEILNFFTNSSRQNNNMIVHHKHYNEAETINIDIYKWQKDIKYRVCNLSTQEIENVLEYDIVDDNVEKIVDNNCAKNNSSSFFSNLTGFIQKCTKYFYDTLELINGRSEINNDYYDMLKVYNDYDDITRYYYGDLVA